MPKSSKANLIKKSQIPSNEVKLLEKNITNNLQFNIQKIVEDSVEAMRYGKKKFWENAKHLSRKN